VSDSTGRPDSSRYRLESRIATGGMGEVWRATDQVLGREVALKVLKPEYSDDPTFRSRFETEARNAAALHHPNVASVFDFGELPAEDGGDKPRPYLVMELVRGEPLSALLRKGEPMPPDVAANLVAQAADGLAAAHQLGIVHRDVKPANLLVTRDRTVKITDFGIARAADAVALTTTGQVIGTPQYLSPEQAEGKTATEASDIYSLGVVLYECLAGRRPFDAESPIATALAHVREQPPPLPDDIPVAMRRTVETALAKDPGDRFTSVAELAAALSGGPVPEGTRTTPALAAVEDDTYGRGTRVLAPTPVGASAADADERRRRGIPAWVGWVAAAIAVVLIVLLLIKLSNDNNRNDDSGGPSSSPSATSSSAPTTSKAPPTTKAAPQTVTVNKGDYVGRPAKDATRDLHRLGLKVQQQSVDNPGDKQENTVEDVNPTGQVQKGSTITLSVYGKPKPTETPSGPPSPPGGSSSPGGGSSSPGGGSSSGGIGVGGGLGNGGGQ
jgi:eukaryotic-like serine/threonine-protein kinase